MNQSERKYILGLVTAAGLLTNPAQAVEFQGSGFLTLAAGKILSGDPGSFVVTDYGQGGHYDKGEGWDLGPDSKLGLQGVASFSSDWSATAQIVSRGAADGRVNLEWLYGTYKATDNLTLQFGRKRLPLFYYSESQDIGLAMPWVRLPPQAYGWDVVNLNGANATYRLQLGDWNATGEAFYGKETRINNPYQEIYVGWGSKTDERWTDITGANLTLANDWLETRLSAVRSNWEVGGTNNGAQTFYAISAMADLEDWIVRSEYSKIDRPEIAEHDWAALLGIGKRFGKWLPMLTYAKFHGKYDDGLANEERTKSLSFSLRYDLSSSSAIKVQYDITSDDSDAGITANASGRYGDSKMLTIAYDKVF